MPTAKKLNNGLTYIPIEKPASKTAAVLLLVKVGSNYETPETYGGAHLLEHLVFKGTKSFSDSQKIGEYLDEVGGDYNAFTGKEMTGYHAVVEKAHIGRALKVMFELANRPLLRQEDFDSEKKVIIEEIKLHEDIPMHLAGDIFFQAMFPNQPIAHNIAGTRKSVERFKYQDFVNFYQSHYRAEKMILAVSADKDTLKNLDLMDYQKIRGGAKMSEISSSKVSKDSARIEIAERKIEQANLILGFLGPSYSSKDRLKMSLLTSVLGGMMSSRMFIEVREKQHLCYNIRSDMDFYQDLSLLSTEAGVKTENLYRAIRAILYEYQKIKSKGISKAELAKGRDNLKGRLAIGLDSSEALASFYGRQWILSGNLAGLDSIYREIDSVTQADILEIAKKYFSRETLSIAVISPKADKAKVSVELNKFR